ncbi:MAG: dipeptidase PepE [Flavobacteriaceae bacterium]|nr:dipeptidase PepE [Flavobacteriaceae bacterium]
MKPIRAILASTSTVHGSGYLEYILETLEDFFKDINEILFIPFARPDGMSHDAYTAIAAHAFQNINKNLKGIHQYSNPKIAIQEAEAIFVGGGNTFLLVYDLYQYKVMDVLRDTIAAGIPYFGTSAGINIFGQTMQNTNDMPIVFPPSYKTLGLVPFNFNAHYVDPDPDSTHKGETRETRIKEYLTQNNIAVVGLREGSWLEINGTDITLKGALSARIFEKNKPAYELSTSLEFPVLRQN